MPSRSRGILQELRKDKTALTGTFIVTGSRIDAQFERSFCHRIRFSLGSVPDGPVGLLILLSLSRTALSGLCRATQWVRIHGKAAQALCWIVFDLRLD